MSSRRRSGVIAAAAARPTIIDASSATCQPNRAAIGARMSPRERPTGRSPGLLNRKDQRSVPFWSRSGQNTAARRRRWPIARAHDQRRDDQDRPPTGRGDRKSYCGHQATDLQCSDRSEPCQNRATEEQEQHRADRVQRRDIPNPLRSKTCTTGQQRCDDRKTLIHERCDRLHEQRGTQRNCPDRYHATLSFELN